MTLILIWLIAFVLPAAAGFVITKLTERHTAGSISRDSVVIHIALLVSIGLSQYFVHVLGLEFPWNFQSPWVLAYVAGIIFAFALLRSFGLLYALSALIQQLTMLSIAFILLHGLPVYVVVLLIVPIYTFLHRMRVKYDGKIMSLFFAWGTASIVLFSFFPSIWLLAALHAFFGTILIRWSVLYPSLKYPV